MGGMRTGFVDKIGSFPVAKRPQGTFFGKVDLTSPPKGAMHTTEGTAEQPFYGDNAPNLTIGKEGLAQHRPFGDINGTLRNTSAPPETNRLVRIQFEFVGFSSVKPWLPASEKQRDLLAAVFQFAAKELDVPANHVWPDVQEQGVVLATENYIRRKSKFPSVPGWYGHGEVPDNEHWDMGSCLVSKLMDGHDDPTFVTAFAIIERVKSKNGTWHSEEVSPFFSERPLLREWTVKKEDDGDHVLRRKIWNAMVENRISVAERKVRPEDVAA